MAINVNTNVDGWKCTAPPKPIPLLPLCASKQKTSNWIGVSCDLRGNIDSINLNINGVQIKGTLPLVLAQLSTLSFLSLDNNKFQGSFPTQMGQLTALRELHLQGNAFSGSLPSSLCALSALDTLDVRGCAFACYYSCLSTVASNDFSTSLSICGTSLG